MDPAADGKLMYPLAVVGPPFQTATHRRDGTADARQDRDDRRLRPDASAARGSVVLRRRVWPAGRKLASRGRAVDEPQLERGAVSRSHGTAVQSAPVCFRKLSTAASRVGKKWAASSGPISS